MSEVRNSELPTGTVTEWSDEQWHSFKGWLKEVLLSETVEIVFTKSDGSERTMNCTLLGDKIAVKAHKLTENLAQAVSKPKRPPPKPNADNLTVFDIDVGDWRSFKIRNLKNIYTLILKYN